MNRVALVLCCGLLALAFPAWSQEKKEARNDKEPPLQPIWRGIPPGARGKDADEAGVYVHLPPADKANGAAVVICPGGGYGGLAISYEGHDVARWLNSQGIAGIVLRYRHAPNYKHPTPMNDAQRAIRVVRAIAKAWK